jgi:hypothetical protein
MRLLALTALAGGVTIIGSVLMLGWLYEGPRRLVRTAACYIGFHGRKTWGVNPVNQNSEPYCRDCGRYPQKVY